MDRFSAGIDFTETCLPFIHVIGEEFEVGVPFVTNDFSARKTAYWDDLSGSLLMHFSQNQHIDLTIVTVFAKNTTNKN